MIAYIPQSGTKNLASDDFTVIPWFTSPLTTISQLIRGYFLFKDDVTVILLPGVSFQARKYSFFSWDVLQYLHMHQMHGHISKFNIYLTGM